MAVKKTLSKFTQKTKVSKFTLEKTTKPRRGKFNNIRTEIDGFKFDSKKEAAYYVNLKRLKEIGIVDKFEMQVIIRLPGKVKYICDFKVYYNTGTPQARIEWVDVKGFKTAVYKLKKKFVEALYPDIKILEV